MKAKDPKSLIFDKTIEQERFIYFTFKNNDNIVSINKNSYDLGCSCENGSLVGVNNRQICYHKKHILDKFNIDIEKFKNHKNLLHLKRCKR